jgi:hypothetical protein
MLGIGICAGALWLWRVPLYWYYLKLDDFVYLARSRTVSSLRAHLATPHNGHIVPLFLLETHLLARLAGSLERLPVVLSWASYAVHVAATAATGHVVAWETGRPARGLAAMAAVGFTSVLGPALLWYSAGQALMTGTLILAMLAALQAWRIHGSWWLLITALLAAAAAPLFWTVGHIGGLAGTAYLWADRRSACRRAAALPLAVSVATGLVVHGVAGYAMGGRYLVALPPILNNVELGPAAAHSAQAVCEALILNNLGLDAATTSSQALVISSGLALFWAWSRYQIDPGHRAQSGGIRPLEAAGAVLVAGGFGMIFAVRGTETTFEGLRTLGWYDIIPEIGAILFISGWSSGRIESPPAKSIEPPKRLELLAFMLFASAMLVLQLPRVERVIFQYDQMSAPHGPDRPDRTPAELAERARAQRQALSELDRIEQTARKRGIGRAEILRDVNPVTVPGLPTGFPGVGAAQLIDVADVPSQSPSLNHSK